MTILLDAVFLYDISPVEKEAQENRKPVRSEDEAALVARARTGDYEAFEELVRRLRNEVFALAYHFVRNREDAWDISQEVFIRAYRGLGRLREQARFKSWLMRITANRCKDFLKKRRLPTVSGDDAALLERQASTGPGPAAQLEAREIEQAVMSALDTLSHKHRTAIVLREFEGMSYDDMARVMGCSVGTVMSRLHHARKKLQRSLTRMGIAGKGEL